MIMKTTELEKRVKVKRIGYGVFRFWTTLYGKELTMLSSDSVLFDVINSGEPCLGLTYPMALRKAHEMVVNANKVYYAI